MAINLPKEIRQKEYPTVILGLAVLIVFISFIVWQEGIGRPAGETEEALKIKPIVKFKVPEIKEIILEMPELTGAKEPEIPALRVFKKIDPLYCPMEETEGSLISEEDCLKESGCFWNQHDGHCHKTPGRINPFLPKD